VSASADVAEISHETKYALGVKLRYNYRLYPAPAQRAALARATKPAAHPGVGELIFVNFCCAPEPGLASNGLHRIRR
jgi:hypothetical protein